MLSYPKGSSYDVEDKESRREEPIGGGGCTDSDGNVVVKAVEAPLANVASGYAYEVTPLLSLAIVVPCFVYDIYFIFSHFDLGR